MKKQIPRGEEDLTCPLHQKSMAEVCHKCPLWIQIRGKHPQSNEEVDQWNCSLALLPMLLLENAQQARHGAAATESFRNEMMARADANAAMMDLVALASPSGRQPPSLSVNAQPKPAPVRIAASPGHPSQV